MTTEEKNQVPEWYAKDKIGDSISAGDIVYDVFDHGSPEKHDEFLAWAGQAMGVMFDHPREGEDVSNGYYQIRPLVTEESPERGYWGLVLAMAQDWLETVDPAYAEELLGFSPQSEEVQRSLDNVKLLI